MDVSRSFSWRLLPSRWCPRPLICPFSLVPPACFCTRPAARHLAAAPAGALLYPAPLCRWRAPRSCCCAAVDDRASGSSCRPPCWIRPRHRRPELVRAYAADTSGRAYSLVRRRTAAARRRMSSSRSTHPRRRRRPTRRSSSIRGPRWPSTVRRATIARASRRCWTPAPSACRARRARRRRARRSCSTCCTASTTASRSASLRSSSDARRRSRQLLGRRYSDRSSCCCIFTLCPSAHRSCILGTAATSAVARADRAGREKDGGTARGWPQTTVSGPLVRRAAGRTDNSCRC